MSVIILTSDTNNGFTIPFDQTLVSSYLNDVGTWVMSMHYGRQTEWHYRLYFSSLN